MPFKYYCELPTPHGIFRMYDTENEQLRVITFGDINKLDYKPIIRLHSSCLASEVFDALDCDCADQLRETMKLIAHEGNGIIFHLHQEGRGHGLSKKIQAVRKMQSDNIDTAESFQALGLSQDSRDYELAISLLKKMNIKQIRLVTNNPRKKLAVEQAGIIVETVNTHPKLRIENTHYLKSKNSKLGHNIPLDFGYNYSNSIHFYHSDQAWGEFSNFSQHAIYLQGQIWRTTEHFYQSQKFQNTEYQEKVRLAASPMQAKLMASKFEEKLIRSNWQSIKEDVMWQAVSAKFSQHPELKALLLSTGQRHIAEHTTNDNYWGDAGNGEGLNRLGELLMNLRDELNMSNERLACVE